jgi:hypothetical protein
MYVLYRGDTILGLWFTEEDLPDPLADCIKIEWDGSSLTQLTPFQRAKIRTWIRFYIWWHRVLQVGYLVTSTVINVDRNTRQEFLTLVTQVQFELDMGTRQPSDPVTVYDRYDAGYDISLQQFRQLCLSYRIYCMEIDEQKRTICEQIKVATSVEELDDIEFPEPTGHRR